MNSDTPLDYALFQLSPRRTRCELLVSGDGKTEKLASGFLKPFVTHLRVAEEQASQAAQSIKLDVEGRKHGAAWFNKGTLERFVRFVSTPEVLELVHSFDTEMSQLEGARTIYSQGTGDQLSGASGENETASAAAADITKKELLRAIDVRLAAVNQDLTMACARASAAGFTPDNVSELLLFADCFGAEHLSEACTEFISLCQRRPELISHQQSPSSSLPALWKGFNDGNVRFSSGSDMSIDEPEVEYSGPNKPLTSSASGPQLVHKPSNIQPPQYAAAESADIQLTKSITSHTLERDMDKETEETIPNATFAEAAQPTGGGGSRRLSVQDRINLFESKQKEQSTSANIINSSLGGGISNRVAGKPEHRRLPSDISVEKSVLRRWSSASEMSIDINNCSSSSYNDKKEASNPAGAFSSSANSQTHSGSKTEEKDASGLKDTATSRSNPIGMSSSSSLSLSQAHVRACPKDRDRAEDVASNMRLGPDLEKELGCSQIQYGVPLGKVQHGGLSDQAATKSRSQSFQDSCEDTGLKDQVAFETKVKAVSTEHVADKVAQQKDQVCLRSQPGVVAGEDVVEVTDQPNSLIKLRTFGTKIEDFGVKAPLESQLQFEASLGYMEGITQKSDMMAQSKQRTSLRKKQEMGRKEAAVSQVQLGTFLIEAEEEFGLQGMKLYRQPSDPAQIRKFQGRGDERVPNQGNAALDSLGSKAKVGLKKSESVSTSSMEQVQVVRPSKGNQELNDELQMKANELEKIFAEHNLRVRGDQISSSRRSKPVDVDCVVPKSVNKRPVDSIPDQLTEGNLLKESLCNEVEFNANLVLKMVDNTDYCNNMKQEHENYSQSDDSRGMFYEKYMQKRDAKLSEEWGSKRAQKEAIMKAMHDSFECSRAEMKAKFAGYANRQDPTSARHRAEKMRSFNARSTIKSKDQTLEFLQGEDEEDLQELSDLVHYGEDKSYSDILFGSEHSMSIQSRRLLSSKSSTPRTPVAPVPRPFVKATTSGSIKRRTQPENPLTLSVPNFSNFRKENTKPSTGLSKVTPRAQSRNFARSKSSNEEINLVKEEKPRRSQSMRKSSANTGELKDLSPLNSDCANLTPLKIAKEPPEQSVPNKIQKSGESRAFLRKGNGVGPGAGAGIATLKASMSSEILGSEDESEELVNQEENSQDMLNDEESERPSAEGNLRTTDFPVDSDSEKLRLSQEPGNSGDPGLDNGDALISPSQADDDLAAVSSKFDTSTGNMQESPGESPGSWHIHHSFSYAQEASDIDAFVDSPTGSPASWNSHPLNQMMEADANQMRKKWGSAQIPVVVTNSPHQPRKDVTKRFKQLLKFGRKSKGAEFLVNDWVSVSTASEGDDETEDGRDIANRSSDDLRKSRMGFSIASYNGFNGGEILPEQVQSFQSSIPNPPANFKLMDDHLSGRSLKVPRSFFSLSSFRSKGSESKLR